MSNLFLNKVSVRTMLKLSPKGEGVNPPKGGI